MVLGRRGYRQLLLGSVKEDPLCQRYTTVTTATTVKPVLTLGGGGWGCSKVCNMVKREKKQTAELLLLNYGAVCLALSSRGSYCTLQSVYSGSSLHLAGSQKVGAAQAH